LKDGSIVEVELNIYEPLVSLKAFDRYFQEVPDITALICICPVAYQMSSVQALGR
jgi:coenzyme F420-reducing hydrogenase alpha subunit